MDEAKKNIKEKAQKAHKDDKADADRASKSATGKDNDKWAKKERDARWHFIQDAQNAGEKNKADKNKSDEKKDA